MSTQEVPEPWASRIVERGFTRRDGGPNVSALARAMDVAVETARRAVHGIGVPEPETVARLADILGADVQGWAGQRVDLGPYVPPQESTLLTPRQRDALTDLIRAIAAASREGGVGHVPAAITRAEGSSATGNHRVTRAGRRLGRSPAPAASQEPDPPRQG